MKAKTDITLLPCPFCGGEAEIDTHQGYRALVTGRLGNRIAAYCRSCDADMGVCVEDVPDIEPEQVADMWNRRAAVEADRQVRMPSDEELLKWAGEEQFFLFCDEDEFLQIAREVLSRYGSSQPATNEALLDLVSRLRALARYQHDDMSVADEAADALISGQPVASVKPNTHFDDDAVDHFATAMKDKLAKARAKGRHGWHECPPEELSAMLRAHVEKGDPRDVANFCMFLWSLGKPISAAPVAQEPVGEAVAMPGTSGGFTMATFRGADVPVGTKLYAAAANGEPFAHLVHGLLPVECPKGDTKDQYDAAYEAGWRNAASWAQRGDLVHDIGSPAYERERDAARDES